MFNSFEVTRAGTRAPRMRAAHALPNRTPLDGFCAAADAHQGENVAHPR